MKLFQKILQKGLQNFLRNSSTMIYHMNWLQMLIKSKLYNIVFKKNEN